MNIYKYIGLAVFASICFIGGTLFGQWSTYDEEYVAALEAGYENQRYEAISIMSFGHAIDSYHLLKKYKESGHDEEFLKLYRNLLEKGVSEIQVDFEGSKPKTSYAFIVKTELDRANRVLAQ